MCPDGTELARDPDDDCNFPRCPPPPACPFDIFVCLDGTELVRDPENDCEFPFCPGICTQDVFECEDGTFVGRDPDNKCDFFPCVEIEIVVCALDVQVCEGGAEIVRVPPACDFPPCPRPASDMVDP